MNCKYLSTFKNYFYNLEQCFWSIANKMYWWSITLERYLLPNVIRVLPSSLKTPTHISADVVDNPRPHFDLDVTAQSRFRWKAGICESQTWWAGIGCGPSGWWSQERGCSRVCSEQSGHSVAVEQLSHWSPWPQGSDTEPCSPQVTQHCLCFLYTTWNRQNIFTSNMTSKKKKIIQILHLHIYIIYITADSRVKSFLKLFESFLACPKKYLFHGL